MVHINLSTLLVNKSYLNETELFWNAVATILGNGEHVWKGATNQRLSDITTTALITIYVKNADTMQHTFFNIDFFLMVDHHFILFIDLADDFRVVRQSSGLIGNFSKI